MCSRWASEYRDYTRASSKPERGASGSGRSLVEVVRDLFRPRRPQVQDAEVVTFPATAARDAEKADREDSRAA